MYDAYADRLTDFAYSLAQDTDVAADAVHAAIVTAHGRADLLRETSRLRAWLYALTRFHVYERLGRTPAHGFTAGQAHEHDHDVLDPELTGVVREALAELGQREREVLLLAVRHGLTTAEIGVVLGLSSRQAGNRLGRAKEQLDNAGAAVILARTGRAHCPDLSALVDSLEGPFPQPLRRRLTRHIGGCEECTDGRRRRVTSERLLDEVPVAFPPLSLRRRVAETCSGIGDDAVRATILAATDRFDKNGFPPASSDRRAKADRGGQSRRGRGDRDATAAVTAVPAQHTAGTGHGRPFGGRTTGTPAHGMNARLGAGVDRVDGTGARHAARLGEVDGTGAGARYAAGLGEMDGTGTSHLYAVGAHDFYDPEPASDEWETEPAPGSGEEEATAPRGRGRDRRAAGAGRAVRAGRAGGAGRTAGAGGVGGAGRGGGPAGGGRGRRGRSAPVFAAVACVLLATGAMVVATGQDAAPPPTQELRFPSKTPGELQITYPEPTAGGPSASKTAAAKRSQAAPTPSERAGFPPGQTAPPRPSATRSPSRSATAPAARLVLSCPGALGEDGAGVILISARNGTVQWSAAASSGVSVSPGQGVLRPGDKTRLAVAAAEPGEAGEGLVTFRSAAGQAACAVSWEGQERPPESEPPPDPTAPPDPVPSGSPTEDATGDPP
ncbi:sigma-70 family RNA polymerase sigma factor [Sphaerisporangium sp. B11E5]|uniref:sigma-70 family RNA polymerase sigma factor n=1 Tax=Sphaerisporangium sp. B11E5 TaxID=3153563 RepID=UPI00325CFAC2